jgi:epoxyqueuosine reductase
MTVDRLDTIRSLASQHGFDSAGVCAPSPGAEAAEAYVRWTVAGMHGEMGYMARPDRVARALDPSVSLPGVKSIVMVARSYRMADMDGLGRRADPSRARISSYAWGSDYHEDMLPRLTALGRNLGSELGHELGFEAMVDFRPLLERDAAARAGLGFIGRNTMLIDPRGGSWTFLGALLVDVELAASGDVKSSAGTCGSCTRCLDACPTNSFSDEYVLDARRCISYLTIELKGPIPRELRSGIGNRVFGCDVCNDVCPYNLRFARPVNEKAFAPEPGLVAPKLVDLISIDRDGFREMFDGTPVMRAKRRGLLRNVCVALGNWGHPSAVPALTAALRDDEPLVRGHAAWALGRIRTQAALSQLSTALAGEADPWVVEELTLALTPCRAKPSLG